MKKKMIFLILTLCVLTGFSQVVPVNIARKMALSHYCHFQDQGSKMSPEDILFSDEITVVDGTDTLYYVFNVSGNKGFEVISSCYPMRPVLAYSFEGRFDVAGQSPALTEVMGRYAAKIKEIRSVQGNSSTGDWNAYFSEYASVGKPEVKSVSPMLTTKWAQGCYYNSYCPVDSAGQCGHAVAGCVPVAACQIMKYHNYPASGIWSNSYTNDPYGVLFADFGATTYNWGNMPDSLTGQNNDVAQLLYHFGVAVEAHYTANSTCASTVAAEKALFSYFKYSRSATTINKADFDNVTWVSVIRNEMDSLRPVYYAYGAHAVVIDGYQGTDYFHVNYGWGGTSDGYYYLNNLYQYNGDRAIIYIKPAGNFLFSDMGASLPGVILARSSCGDYDNDGDLDILFNGCSETGSEIMKIYRNDNGNFTDANITLPNVGGDIDLEWGDYDNDGDFDILTSRYGCLLKNTGNVFTNQYLNASVGNSSVDWGDYNRDGYLDAIISGHYMNYVDTFYLFKNNITSFQGISVNMVGLFSGTTQWADFDNDGDEDIFTNGRDWMCDEYCNLYLNNSFGFMNSGVSLIAYYDSRSSIFDYDNDGDMDMFLYGYKSSPYTNHSSIYNNNNLYFTRTFQIMKFSHYSDSGFGDFDSDGDMDLVYSGQNDMYSSSQYYSYLYENRDDGFHIYDAGLSDLAMCSISVGDFDNDGDMDVFIAGRDSSGASVTKIFRNNLGTNVYSYNTPPATPSGLTSSVSYHEATLSWNKSTDDKTNQNSLTYNIRIGTTPGGVDIVSPLSDVTTGFRRVSKYGNTQLNNSWKIKNLPNGTYYWSVQAIDNCYKASAFAAEQTFTITGLDADMTEISDGIMIYPNPSDNGIFTVEGSNIEEIEILTIYGQPMNKIKIAGSKNKTEFSVKKKGVYLVRIQSNDNNTIRKVIFE